MPSAQLPELRNTASIAHPKGGLKNGLEEIAYNAGIMCSFRLWEGNHGYEIRVTMAFR